VHLLPFQYMTRVGCKNFRKNFPPTF